jgi:hypothetical protein
VLEMEKRVVVALAVEEAIAKSAVAVSPLVDGKLGERRGGAKAEGTGCGERECRCGCGKRAKDEIADVELIVGCRTRET